MVVVYHSESGSECALFNSQQLSSKRGFTQKFCSHNIILLTSLDTQSSHPSPLKGTVPLKRSPTTQGTSSVKLVTFQKVCNVSTHLQVRSLRVCHPLRVLQQPLSETSESNLVQRQRSYFLENQQSHAR